MTLLEQFSCAENLENLPYNVFDEVYFIPAFIYVHRQRNKCTN